MIPALSAGTGPAALALGGTLLILYGYGSGSILIFLAVVVSLFWAVKFK